MKKRKLNSLTFIMSFMIILFFVILFKNENVDANSNEQVIKTYYDNINSKNYSELYKLFSDKYLQETRCVYDNAENVEKNEVGYSTWKLDALKACAVAIKNYGVVRIKRHKYAGQGYDVKSTTVDQVYDPGKENIAICDKAVDDIWGVIWLDADSKVFPGFHVDSKAVDSHAVRNGGILSQHGAQKLAKDNGYSWVDILRYYYDRKKNIAYYNPEVAVGTTTFVNGL